MGKLVSNLSNENKQVEVVFTHTQKLCRTLYDVVGNAPDTLVTFDSYFEHSVAQYICPYHVNTIVLI